MTRGQSQGQRGLSYIEMMVSTTLLVTLLMTVSNSLVSSQQIYASSETGFRVQQSNRVAMDMIKEDLTGAQIDGWLRVVPGDGRGNVLVKFRRLGSSITTNGTTLDWDNLNTMRMYVWCSAASMGFNPCAKITPAPRPNELLLVRANPATNPTGLVSGDWIRDRVVTADLNLSGMPTVAPFDLSVIRADNAGLVSMTNAACLVAGQECRHPFSTTPPTPPSPLLAGSITVQLRTAVQTFLAQRTIASQENLKVRNRQD